MTDAQQARYVRAIRHVAGSRGATVVTPDILFQAADAAVEDAVSQTKASVGLQPGTLNPIHDGHLVAALTGILFGDLDYTLLVIGGSVPDKPGAADFQLRSTMTSLAVRERGVSRWVAVTPIRQQVFEMFSRDPEALRLAGDTEGARRSNTDIAAFVWLFRANPQVTWTYLVGSDKVTRYGRNDERSLVVDTLSDPRANVQVLYFTRRGLGIDMAEHIAPYPWMLERWNSGFFSESPRNTCSLSSSAIRLALAQGSKDCEGHALSECMSPDVLRYIASNETLRDTYLTSGDLLRPATDLQHDRNR